MFLYLCIFVKSVKKEKKRKNTLKYMFNMFVAQNYLWLADSYCLHVYHQDM